MPISFVPISKVSKVKTISSVLSPSKVKISEISGVSRPSKTSRVSKVSKLSVPYIPSIKVPPYKPPPRVPRKKKRSKSDSWLRIKAKPGFNAFVKHRGKWIKTTKKPVSRLAALSSGARTADTYTQRSFLIKKARKPATPSLDESWNFLKSKFYRKKKNKRIFVERSRFAIDSRKEVEGIPFKGIKAKKHYAKLRRWGLM
jgi:hypothetical protein